MNYKTQYVNKLPKVNCEEFFIVKKECEITLAQDWFDYIKTIIEICFSSKNEPKFKTIKSALDENNPLEIADVYTRNLLGMGDEFSVIDISFKNGKTEIVSLKTYEELVDIFLMQEEPILKRKIKRKPIVDRFFAFMWSKNKLLYPIKTRIDNYQRPKDWKELIADIEIVKNIEERFLENHLVSKKTAILSLLTATSWRFIEDVEEKDIRFLEEAVTSSKDLTYKRKKYFKQLTNVLRISLIDSGRKNIGKPRDMAREKVAYSKLRYLDWIDLDEYPNLKLLIEEGKEFPSKLKRDGLATGTIDSHRSAISNFFKYIILYYPKAKINIATIDDMFEPTNECNLFNMLTLQKSEVSAKSELSVIIKFLIFCELYSTKAKKNTPQRRKKTSYLPYRVAMSKEMVQHAVDIIKNRPPNMRTAWKKQNVDSSWWKHDVYPVYPLMMLFGYYIPLRGEQVRNLCRENSFIFGDDGRIESLVINTDKNVNRKYLQEIPCVWEDLQIFVPFLEWHKRRFKHLPKVTYHDDDNSPWEDIEPLFLTPQVLKPMARETHFTYHKKILCQYQLEVMLEAKKTNRDDYPKVAWAKKGKEFFKDIDELNNCSNSRMKDIEVMYDLHSLRVTGATRYLESGLGLNIVMQLTGHTTPDTLTRIYINLTRKEKEVHLKSAMDKIFFGDSDSLVKNTSSLLGGEIADAYEKNKDDVKIALKDNALFSLARKKSIYSTQKEHKLGIDISVDNHPSTWFPMIHGICPAVKCPEGRERRCSLCPYLITGKLFINGIILKVNQAFAKFNRASIQKQEEFNKGYKNQALAESLEVMLEEILGWIEIIDKINSSFNQKKSFGSKSSAKDVVNNIEASLVGMESINKDLAYLKNAYDAKLMGVEQDMSGLRLLTIKAVKIAVKAHDYSSVDLISDNEEKSIDYLMSYYQGKKLENSDVKNFISSVREQKRLGVI